MSSFLWFRDVLKTIKKESPHNILILPEEEQIKAWSEANRKMSWNIGEEEFIRITDPPSLTERDKDEGFVGVALFYGFGDDGFGHSDSVLSGKIAWNYACKSKKRRVWKSEYINFDNNDAIRLRPGAPPRPKGFYFAKIQPGVRFQSLTVSQVRKRFNLVTGCGPEGFQLLCITHFHIPEMMCARKTPFMALSDYDVAPYGFNDFFDVPQLFSSKGILGLGIGNVDHNYPGFGIPTISF